MTLHESRTRIKRIKSPSSERTKKESLLDVVATQQKRAHMAIINEQWKLVFQVAILIVGTRKFSLTYRCVGSRLANVCGVSPMKMSPSFSVRMRLKKIQSDNETFDHVWYF